MSSREFFLFLSEFKPLIEGAIRRVGCRMGRQRARVCVKILYSSDRTESLMHWFIIVSFLLVLPVHTAKAPCCACLPKGIQSADVVTAGFNPSMKKAKQTITVAEKLASLRARCKRGKLLDGAGKEIRFFQLTGCWGNPPDNYQEILERQNKELNKLRKRYTVIEMTCNPSGVPIP